MDVMNTEYFITELIKEQYSTNFKNNIKLNNH